MHGFMGEFAMNFPVIVKLSFESHCVIGLPAAGKIQCYLRTTNYRTISSRLCWVTEMIIQTWWYTDGIYILNNDYCNTLVDLMYII